MFARRLAWQMGELSVEAMLDRLSPEDFNRWQAAYLTGQLDDGWQQAAMICAEIRNLPKRMRLAVWGGTLDPKELAKPSDFLPTWEEDKQPVRDTVKEYFDHLAQKFGKK